MALYSMLSRLAGMAAPLTRGMTLGVRGACFDLSGRIFLVRHSYMAGWYLPGGGVERGESLEEALERELREEGGIVPDEPARLFSVYFNRRRQRDHVALYLCRAFSRPEPPAYPNREIAEADFFDPDALPGDTSPGTLRRLDEILRGTPPARHW